MKINDFKLLNTAFKNENIKLKEQFANYSTSDEEIKGGRAILNKKSNQLFTAKFEKNDVTNFITIWSSFRNDRIYDLQNKLLKESEIIAKNYRCEVSPLEVMLYTSNKISSSFFNIKLIEETGKTISTICNRYPFFISSLEHIINVWQWPHVLNICMVGLGYICSNPEIDSKYMKLLNSSFNYHKYDENLVIGCFLGLINSKKDEFVPDILSVVHDLKGSDQDKIIGNFFKDRFIINFPKYYDRLTDNIFWDSSIYVRNLIKKIIRHDLQEFSLLNRYKNAVSPKEKNKIIEEGLRIVTNGGISGINDAINMLVLASSNEISQKLYGLLDLISGKKNIMKFIIKYFSYIKFKNAIQKMVNLPTDNIYYATCRVALFRQHLISTDTLMNDYLLETRIYQVEDYIENLWGVDSNTIYDLKLSIYKFFTQVDEICKYPQAINNYERLVDKYPHFYDQKIGEILQSYLGYNTILGEIQIKITEQHSCLAIFDMIIDSSNYKRYENFLYYVAAENALFSPIIREYAKEILRNINNYQIKL